MRLLVLPLFVLPLVLALPVRDAAPLVTASPLRRLVRFEDTVRNETGVALHDVRCDLLLPDDGALQRVRWLRLSGHDWTLSRDALGQWCATASVARLGPGQAVTFGWLAAVELSTGGGGADDPHGLDPAERDAALADDPVLALDDPSVVAATQAVRRVAPSGTPEALAFAALRHVHEHVAYELDGGWRTAPDVLRAGSGSCSETTFAYVALCRALGVPARWIGGTLQRAGSPGRVVDSTFHRLAEVWLPDSGWTRVETTPGATPYDEPWGPGAPQAALLVLARGGSAAGAAGLYYHARNEWAAPRGSRARPRIGKRAFWVVDADGLDGRADPLDGMRPGHRPSFARCEALLADVEGFGDPVRAGHVGSAPPVARRAARTDLEAATWLFAAGHPGALRAGARAVRSDASCLDAVVALERAACTPELREAYAPLLGRPPAEFEAWWARSAPDVAPERPGLLRLTPRR